MQRVAYVGVGVGVGVGAPIGPLNTAQSPHLTASKLDPTVGVESIAVLFELLASYVVMLLLMLASLPFLPLEWR